MAFKFTFLSLLILITANSYAFKLETIQVNSKCMKKEVYVNVITPNGHKKEGKKFPVIYLLHGFGGNHKQWLGIQPELKNYSDQYQVIIVCPDGTKGSWYFDSPIDKSMKYETFVSKELIKAIDTKYNTIKNRKGRAIAGLSMGGHGAFYLAFRNQNVWGAAGSMSGGVDIRPFPEKWQIAQRLGSYEENPKAWEKNTVINLVPLLKEGGLKLIFDCGTNDFFFQVNRNLHAKLIEKNISHDYTERPGKHNGQYWANAIKYQLLFFSNYFKTE